MPYMTFDWLSAAILRPMLETHGMRLPDLATSLHNSVGMGEFKTAHSCPGLNHAELMTTDSNPFGAISERRRLPGMPEMWGSIARDDDERRVLMSGIALHPSLTALPSSGGGMLLFRSTLPDTVALAASGQPFTSLMSHPSIDNLGLIVRRLRPATTDETDHISRLLENTAAMVATFRNDKSARRVQYRV